MTKTDLIVTITGPSCAGKSTLEKLMRDQLGFEIVVSTTSRPMREGEQEGREYFFLDKTQFKRHAEMGAFVENVEFNGHYYGASVAEVQRIHNSGKPVVIVVEPEGKRQIADYARTVGWNVYSVFLCNPPTVMAERFLTRFAEEKITPKIFNAYTSRLGSMMSVEVGWQHEAAISPSPYDMRIWKFDESNSKQVLDTIRHEAMERMAA